MTTVRTMGDTVAVTGAMILAASAEGDSEAATVEGQVEQEASADGDDDFCGDGDGDGAHGTGHVCGRQCVVHNEEPRSQEDRKQRYIQLGNDRDG
jgi:hypothetical protein